MAPGVGPGAWDEPSAWGAGGDPGISVRMELQGASWGRGAAEAVSVRGARHLGPEA